MAQLDVRSPTAADKKGSTGYSSKRLTHTRRSVPTSSWGEVAAACGKVQPLQPACKCFNKETNVEHSARGDRKPQNHPQNALHQQKSGGKKHFI